MVDDSFAKTNAELIKKLLHESAEDKPESSIPYPQKSNRYCRIGWNAGHQACYTDAEKEIIKNILEKFKIVADSPENLKHFELQQTSKWYETWQCSKPERNYAARSFTLESNDAKDPSKFPLWNFANRLAKGIANKHSERAKNQNPDLVNDPTMLVLEELKSWLITHLANKDSSDETLLYISKRQNYIRNIIPLLPDFGSDHSYLYELSTNLDEAKNIVRDYKASQKLPELLSNIHVKAKNLEDTIGSYLHFLPINEEVSENFSDEFFEGKGNNCISSPICRIYRELNAENAPKSQANELQLGNINRFYNLVNVSDNENNICLKLDLKIHLLDKIKFAAFVNDDVKKQYLESIALLDSLKTVSSTLDSYKSLQTSVGTYVFAIHYLEETKRLVNNYLLLINQVRTKIANLIKIANLGNGRILANPNSKQAHKYFIKNLRALDESFSKGTTLDMQLEQICTAAKESVLNYHNEMQKLVADIESGKATTDINKSMRELITEINRINLFLPAQLSDNEIKISKELVNTQLKQLPDKNESLKTKTSLAPQQITLPFDYGLWDLETKIHPLTKEKIYTYNVFKDDQIVGSADFYGQPSFCRSSITKQHNIISLTGVLEGIHIPDAFSTDNCSHYLAFLDNTVIRSGLQGFFRGSSNVVEKALCAKNYNPNLAHYVNQLVFYSSIFTMNFTRHYSQMMWDASLLKMLDSFYYAAYSTTELFVINKILDFTTCFIDNVSAYAKSNSWNYTAAGLKKLSSLFSFGLFAYSAENKEEAVASFIAGAGAQIATEYVGEKIIKKFA